MSFISFTLVIFLRPNVLLFLLAYFASRWIDFKVFDAFQEWFFNLHLLAPLFKNLASKDINVIFIMFFILYEFILIFNILYFKIIRKKWELKSIFVVLTISSYLVITLLFHYFLVEKNYKDAINNELQHLEKVVKENNTQNFNVICVNQNYICGLSKEEIKNKINNKEFSSFVDKIPDNNYVKGNFPFGGFDKVFLIQKEENKWVINNDFAGKQFNKTENYLMICLDVAHTFWYLFFIWLNLFHFRIGKRK